MQFPVNDIAHLIPQKQPFVFVDRLLYADDSLTRSSFTVKQGSVFVKNGSLQEAGLMENIAQTAALRAGYTAQQEGNEVKNGFIGNVKNFEVVALPSVGDEIITEVKIAEHIFNVTILTGTISMGEQLIAHCEMKVFTDN